MSHLRDSSGGLRDPADAAIEVQYRAASTEQPGAAADATILALAHAAVAAPAQGHAAGGTAANDASWTRRWRAPLALAASVVLTFGIVTRINLEPPDGAQSRAGRAGESAPAAAPVPSTSLPAESSPAAAPASSSAPPPAPSPAAPAAEAKRADTMTAPRDRKQDAPAQPLAERAARRESPAADESRSLAKTEGALDNLRAPAATAPPAPAAPAVSAPAPAQAIAPPARVADIASEASARAAGGAVSTQGTAAPAQKKATSALTILSPAQETVLTPERWLDYLIGLRQRGEHDAADASLLRFRARYPEQPIPAGAASRLPR